MMKPIILLKHILKSFNLRVNIPDSDVISKGPETNLPSEKIIIKLNLKIKIQFEKNFFIIRYKKKV